MRGKTCEVKAAAPKGQAPNRGGKANRSNRGGPRNQHRAQAHQLSSLGHNDHQFPVMYQNENYNMPYPQALYSMHPGVQGYVPPVYNQVMPRTSHNQQHAQPQGSHVIADCDPRDVGLVGSPYFFTSPSGGAPPDRFLVPNAFPPIPQIPANFQQPSYAFVPFVPDHTQTSFPTTEMGTMVQPMQQHVQDTDETKNNGNAIIEKE